MKLNSRVCAMALTLGMAATPILPVWAYPVPSMQDRDQNRDRDDQARDRDDQNRNRDRDDQNRNRDRDDQNRDRDHDRDNRWANNKYYKMGQKDADDDRRHNRQGKHHRKFKDDDDQRAYEAGYGAPYGERH